MKGLRKTLSVEIVVEKAQVKRCQKPLQNLIS